MASWSELREECEKEGYQGLVNRLQDQLSEILKLRSSSSVIFYATSFLQKPGVDGSITITREDINGFMLALYGAPVDKGLTLILHTPGGDPNAVESIVEYLHSKFAYIEVIVPYLAMSGGAMISLASDLLVLGRQSQLGPIDPQISQANKTHSARAIQEGFSKAREDINANLNLAHLWAPILQNMGPSLFLEAEKALSYSKELVVNWLYKRMFKDIHDEGERKKQSNKVAAYFNAEDVAGLDKIHVHGQSIGAEKLKELGIKVEMLEGNQKLQNSVLTAYHVMTLIFEKSSTIKFIFSDKGQRWVKN